ncbi:DUF998 domain-containing protein [Roseimicrobium gellanilyticum]|uniref:DUF998 domain-containing protein n=1 Tax=Roseimicrobium gellanilyticum TaxID=748857 RepID=UPI001472BFAE|nr:DUF998 domain-containing protein [Roseimicrobium gellanilyticum]
MAFLAGHLLSAGTTWNFSDGKTLNPWDNYVSDYAYRSPVWWLFTGCMLAFAVVQAWFAWRIFSSSTHSAKEFLVVSCFAFGALSMIEVAVFPVKPPEISLEELQARMDAGAWDRLWASMKGVFHQATERSAHEVFTAFSGDRAHFLAITRSMAALLLGMAASLLLDQCRRGRGAILVLIVVALAAQVVAMVTGRQWLPGLWQRVGFLAVFGWMLVMRHLLFNARLTR